MKKQIDFPKFIIDEKTEEDGGLFESAILQVNERNSAAIEKAAKKAGFQKLPVGEGGWLPCLNQHQWRNPFSVPVFISRDRKTVIYEQAMAWRWWQVDFALPFDFPYGYEGAIEDIPGNIVVHKRCIHETNF